MAGIIMKNGKLGVPLSSIRACIGTLLKSNLLKNFAMETLILRGQHKQSSNEVPQTPPEVLDREEQILPTQHFEMKDPKTMKTDQVYEDGPSLMDTLWRSKKDYWPLPVGTQNRTKYPGDDPYSNNLL
uniref:Unkown protein n=1 Tax=Riptortus pedestris TaxID=329032 RepID=R4WJM3_RIPPE|nr:unkown protein [Riptortus pedestris]